MNSTRAVQAINILLLMLVIGVPLIFVQETMFPFILVKTALFQALAEIIIFLWVSLALDHPECRPRRTPFAVCIAAFLAVVTLTAFLGEDLAVSLWSNPARALGAVALWHFGLLSLALSSLGERVWWDKVFGASIATSALAASGALLTAPGNAFALFFLFGGSIVRPGATFGYPSFLAGYLLFNVFLGTLLALRWKGQARGKFVLAAVLIDVLAIFATQTRGDIIGAMLGFFIFLFWSGLREARAASRFTFKGNRKLSAALAIPLFVVSFFATRELPFWKHVPGFARLTDVREVLGSAGLRNRFLVWELSRKAFRDHPSLGRGIENFNLAFQRYYDPKLLGVTFDETSWDKPHNVFIEHALAGGVAGFLAYLGLLGGFFYSAVAHRDWQARAVMLVLLVAYAVRSLVVFDTIGTYLMFFLIAAWLDRRAAADGSPLTPRMQPVWRYSFVAAAIVVAYVLNWQTVRASHLEHQATSYFVFGDAASSVGAFRRALGIWTPYREYTFENLASVVKQGDEQGVAFPNLETLQGELARGIEGVIHAHPKNYRHYILLAEFKNQFRRFDPRYLDEAEGLIGKALALSPKHQEIYYVLASNRLLRGKYDEAASVFEKAVALNPEAGDPHFYFGIVAYRNGDVAKGDAEIALAERLGRGPFSAQEAIVLATLVGNVKHDYQAAVRYYRHALEFPLDPMQAREVMLRIATAYYLGGDTQNAKRAFEEFLTQGGNLTQSAAFSDLKPVLDELGVRY